MPTPQLVEKPKARLKAGLRRIALTLADLEEQFLEAWPEGNEPPQQYYEWAEQHAWEAFWEDVSQWGDAFDAGFVAANHEQSIYARMIWEISEKLLEEEYEQYGYGDWVPIYTGLKDNGWDPEGLDEEFWFPKWLNTIIPAHLSAYTGIFFEEFGNSEEAEAWYRIHHAPPGIGAELQGEEDLVIAKKTAQFSPDKVGAAYFTSADFRNTFIHGDLPDGYNFVDVLKTYIAGNAPGLEDVITGTIERVTEEAADNGGMLTPLPELADEEWLAKKYLNDWSSLDDSRVEEIIRDDYGHSVEDSIQESAVESAYEDWNYRLAEEFGHHGNNDDIAKHIAAELRTGVLSPEEFIEKWENILSSNRNANGDYKEIYDLVQEWQEAIDDGTINYDDEDYAHLENQELSHEYWLQQRRNRTPQGNVYDVGDSVQWMGSQNQTWWVADIRQGDEGDWQYQLSDGQAVWPTWAVEWQLMPAPPPQQTMWPQEDLTTASILDEPAETLDPVIFDLQGDQTAPKIHDDVREQILTQLGKARVNPDAIKAVLFFGSSAAYQYDPDSDFDIAVVVDPSLARQGDSILGLNREISNELFIAGHPVTYFFRQDDYPVDGSDAIYDVVGNFWIRVPERSESAMEKPEYSDTIEDAKEWAKVLDTQIGELRRDVIDYEKLQGAYQRASDGRKQELYNKVQQVISQLNEDVAGLAGESDALHETRLEAFQKDLDEMGENAAEKYLSRNWIPENVLYKVLERYRYTQLLKMMDKLNKEGLFDDQNQLKLEYSPSIKSAMEKPEDEIEPGDLMTDEMGHPVVINDLHDTEEGYQYEMYDIMDGRGNPDEVEKLDLSMVDENPERLLPRENPEMKTAASGGTGYGDYQEKITNTSGSSMAGDVSGSHEPDVYPMDPDPEEGPPVPSQEYAKSKDKADKIKHRNSVSMRKIDRLATEAVGLIRMGMFKISRRRKAQVDQNAGGDQYATKPAVPNPMPYQPSNVAGQPLGGGYSTNETQQGEQATGEASEDENLAATQQNYDALQQGTELNDQQQADEMTKQYQLRMMGASVIERKKLQLITGSSVGAETPADSSVSQLESSSDGRLNSKTDETRKVLLHERDEDAKGDNATFPKVDDQLKPLP